MNKKHIVVLSGAGISADSGLETFRDEEGLWAKHRVEDVCTPEGLKEIRTGWIFPITEEPDQPLLTSHIKKRQTPLAPKEPLGAQAIARRTNFYNVDVITQL